MQPTEVPDSQEDVADVKFPPVGLTPMQAATAAMSFSHDPKRARLDPGKESTSGSSTPRGRTESRVQSGAENQKGG
eukprot:4909545-Alexandrium_andersonii.AAC.1